MRKLLLLCALVAMMVGVSTALFAGGVNYNTNHSAEFCKMMSRNASTEPDAVFFNPAGMALMDDGLYLYLSNQIIHQPVDIRAQSKTRTHYKGTKGTWYFPNGYIVLKKGKFALGGTAMGIGGGGSGTFNKGLQMLDLSADSDLGSGKTVAAAIPALAGFFPPAGQGFILSKVEASSAVYAVQVCGAYQVADNVGVSLGYRFMFGHNSYKIRMGAFPNNYWSYIFDSSNFKNEQNGIAHSVIAGVSFRPIENLTVGLRGEYSTPLRLKNKNTKEASLLGFADSSKKYGGETHTQSAPLISAGLGYKVGATGLLVMVSGTYFFNQFTQLKGNEKNYAGGYDLSVGLDYTLSAIPLSIGCGYLYAESGARPSARNQTDEALDSHSVGAGFSYKIAENYKLTLATIYSYYVPENVNKGQRNAKIPSTLAIIPARYKKVSYDVAIGLTAKVM